MNNNVIGTKFEKYVSELLRRCGTRADRNVMYHKGKRACQVDLEYSEGLFFRKRTILECKYIGPGNSLDFNRAYAQLGEVLLFTGVEQGILVTNAKVHDLEAKQRRYHVGIYDISALLDMRFGSPEGIASRIERIDKEIRGMPYDPEKDTSFKHRRV